MSDSGGTRLTIDNDLYPETPAQPAANPLAPYGYEQPNAGYQPPLPAGVNRQYWWQMGPDRPYASGLPKLAEQAQKPTWGDVEHRLAGYAIDTAKNITQGIWQAGPGTIQRLMTGELQPGSEEAARAATDTALTIGAMGSPIPRPLGSLGTFGGLLSQTASKPQHDLAMMMEKRGANRDEIFNRTGWFRGADKEWRYIIPDRGAELRMENLETHHYSDYAGNPEIGVGVHMGKGEYRLEDILKHDELYKAYPWARDIKVKAADVDKVRPGSENMGGYNPDRNTMTIQMTDKEDFMRTVLHEISHAIQARQGFARGGAVSEFLPRRDYIDLYHALGRSIEQRELEWSQMPKDPSWWQKRKHAKEINLFERMARDINLSADKYLSLGGEVEARANEAMWHLRRWDMPPWEAGEFMPARGGRGIIREYTPFEHQIIKKDPILLDPPRTPPTITLD